MRKKQVERNGESRDCAYLYLHNIFRIFYLTLGFVPIFFDMIFFQTFRYHLHFTYIRKNQEKQNEKKKKIQSTLNTHAMIGEDEKVS